MERQSRHRRTQIEDGVFVALVVLVSIAFALVVEPFFGAILWGVIVAILFIPVNQGLLKLIPGHRNSAAVRARRRALQRGASAARSERRAPRRGLLASGLRRA